MDVDRRDILKGLIGAGVMAARKMNRPEPPEALPPTNPDGNSGSAGTE